MDPRAFYGRKTTKVFTLAEADPAAIVVLPRAAGDAGDQDSDIEEIPENPEEEYEPAGELEVEQNIENEFDNEILPLQKKRKLENIITWKKSATFSKPMQVENAVINQKLEELEEKTPYEIWKSIFLTEILKHIVFKLTCMLIGTKTMRNSKY